MGGIVKKGMLTGIKATNSRTKGDSVKVSAINDFFSQSQKSNITNKF